MTMTNRKKAAIATVISLGFVATAAAFAYLNRTRECLPDAAILETLRAGGCDIPTTTFICETIPDIAFATAKCGQELLTKALLAGHDAGKTAADFVSVVSCGVSTVGASVAGIFAAKYSCKSDRVEAFREALHEEGREMREGEGQAYTNLPGPM